MPTTTGIRKQNRKRGYAVQFIAIDGEISVTANPSTWAEALDAFREKIKQCKRDKAMTGAEIQLLVDGKVFMNEIIPHP